ncbi:MAG: hypothetical protein C5B60_08480 [Chloroflexi bacterium]|nr:MAG: hypothetical protein C5B60_08480 [Chloroflexota bacterium]
MPFTDLATERQHLAAMQEKLVEITAELGILQDRLRPYYPRKRTLSNQIIHTHISQWSPFVDGAAMVTKLRFDADAKAARQKLFPQLDNLNCKYAPDTDLLRRCRAQSRELTRHIEHLRKWIERTEAKQRKETEKPQWT